MLSILKQIFQVCYKDRYLKVSVPSEIDTFFANKILEDILSISEEFTTEIDEEIIIPAVIESIAWDSEADDESDNNSESDVGTTASQCYSTFE